jgi:hypothetical protein
VHKRRCRKLAQRALIGAQEAENAERSTPNVEVMHHKRLTMQSGCWESDERTGDGKIA